MIKLFALLLLLQNSNAIFLNRKTCGPKISDQQVARYFEVRETSEYSEDYLNSEEYAYFNVEAQKSAPKVSNLMAEQIEGSCEEAEHRGNCEPGWRSWSRPTGEWCMKIIYENNVDQPTAEKRCVDQGAKLSGFQNQLESLWVTLSVSTHISPTSGGVWLGYKRRPACYHVGQTANCTAFNTFEWTDGVTTGTDGILWLCGQPDNARSATRNQACARLVIGTTSYVDHMYQVGTVDDVECDFDFTKTPGHEIKAYVCGKKAK